MRDQDPLLRRILENCRGREFNTIEALASKIPGASCSAAKTTVLNAVDRGLLRARIYKQMLLDGPILIISQIRG